MKLMKNVPTQGPMIRDEFDRLFDQFFGPGLLPQAPRAFETLWQPALDFSENEKEFIVRAEIPGIPKEDLEISLDGQVLTIAGRRDFEKTDKGEEFFWRERETGKFVRMVRLPTPADPAKIIAAYHDGIVTIRVPKLHPTIKTRIPVT